MAYKPKKNATLCEIMTTNSAALPLAPLTSTLNNRRRTLTAALQRSPRRFRRRPNNEEPSRGGVKALTEELRDWVKSHNGDPEADTVRRAIQTLVAAVASTVAK